MDLQAEKYSLIEYITQIKEANMISQLKAFIASKEKDFWDELTAQDKAAINEGINQLDNGEYVSYEEVKSDIKKQFNF